MTRADADQDRIWLIGLMGCGKSTVGRLLALRLGCRYLDNDITVEVLAGRSSVDLADAGGELLHDWESRYVRHLAELPGGIVAGIPASTADRPEDLRLLSRTGLLVHLQCDVETLVARIEADAPRPWIRGNAGDLIAGMLAERSAALEESAELIVDASGPVGAIVERIAKAFHGRNLQSRRAQHAGRTVDG
jgi:shikimate kinase